MSDPEFERVPLRKAAAGSVFDQWEDFEFYVGVLEDKGFTYDQAEQVIEYLRECFGAYKLEFTWGTAEWSDFDDAPATSFGYTNWTGDYGDGDDYCVYAPDLLPVIIRFDLPDLRRTVREHACMCDADPLPEQPHKPSMLKARQEMVTKLSMWRQEIDKLVSELEAEIDKIEGEINELRT